MFRFFTHVIIAVAAAVATIAAMTVYILRTGGEAS